jgi:hypothetical protein
MTFYVQAFDKAGNSARSLFYSYAVPGIVVPPLLPIAVAVVILAVTIVIVFYFSRIRRPKSKRLK